VRVNAQLTPTPEAAAPVLDPEKAPSVGGVFREVPLDLWRFVSLDTAMVLGAGGGAAGLAHIWDDDLATEVQVSTTFNNALEPGHKYGQFSAMLGGSVAVYSIGRMTRHSHLAVVGADLTRGLFVSQAWVQGLKYAVQRERPDKSNNVSFPSGHAAGGFAVAAVLARHYGWKAAIPAYAGAAYIATARVHDDKHYLSDVVFGAAMGIAGSRTVLRTGQYRVQLAPAIAPGRIGLTATVVPPRQRTTTAFPQ
jgi:membrane-associated phospholipid phosphatase